MYELWEYFFCSKVVIGFWQIVLIYKKDRSTEAHKMNNEYVINLCVKNSKLFVTQFLVESSQQDLNCIYIFALRTSYLTVQLKYYTIITILLMWKLSPRNVKEVIKLHASRRLRKNAVKRNIVLIQDFVLPPSWKQFGSWLVCSEKGFVIKD